MSYVTKHEITSWPSAKQARNRRYKKGQVLHHQDDDILQIAHIKSGWVKVVDYDANGQEKVLLLLHEGDLMPVVWKEGVRSNLHYWYEAVTDLETESVAKEDLERLLDDDRELAHQVLYYTQSMLHELLLRIETIEVGSAKTRLVHTLHYLAEKSSKDRTGYIVSKIKPTQALLGALTGISRETVSSVMSGLEKEKLIKFNSNRDLLINAEIKTMVQSKF